MHKPPPPWPPPPALLEASRSNISSTVGHGMKHLSLAAPPSLMPHGCIYHLSSAVFPASVSALSPAPHDIISVTKSSGGWREKEVLLLVQTCGSQTVGWGPLMGHRVTAGLILI